MDLFNTGEATNLLPGDGVVNYYGKVLKQQEAHSYTYSNTTKQALPWTKELIELKKIAEKITGTTFNSCLLNLYHNGGEGMAQR